MNIDAFLTQFQAKGLETCFHDRHINPQIYAGLNGENWSLKDYEARGGYQALRKVLGIGAAAPMTQDEIEELLNGAMDLMADFREDEAEEIINTLIAQLKSKMNSTPEDADRYYYWGRSLALLEENEQALLRFEKALKAKPDHEGALWETTTLLLYELDRPEGAKAILEQSLIPLFPGNELYTEALAAAETLIRRRGPKAMPKDVEEEDSEEAPPR